MGMIDRLMGRSAPSPRMQGDPILEQLAEHLAALAYGDGELPSGAAIPGGQRDRFIRLTPLSSAVDLISSLTAQLVCGGGMTVRNRMDEKVENRRTMAVLNMLTHSPDGGQTPAATWVEDVATDYLLDGNGLVVPTFGGAAMIPIMLTRYRPHGAFTTQDDGPLAYLAMKAHAPRGMLDRIPARDMMHIRWPLKQRGHLGEDGREHFAVAPVTLFARAMVTAILQDAYVERRYRKAPTAQVGVSYDTEKMPAEMTPEQREKMRETLTKKMLDSPALGLFAADFKEMSGAPVHEHVMMARQYAVQEVARIYRLPPPLLAAPIGQWSRGVNEQVMKMAWRSGLSIHVHRFLAPLQTRLLLPGERFVVDPTEFVRGDASGVAELINATQGDAQRNPVLSREELRHAGGWPRVPDGEIEPTIQEKTAAEPMAGGPQN